MGCSLEEEVIMLNSERVLNIRSIELTHYVLQAPPRNVWPSPPCRQSEALSGIISQDGRKQVGPKIELDMLGGSRLPWYKTIPKGCAPSYHCCAGRPENVHTQAPSTSTKYKYTCKTGLRGYKNIQKGCAPSLCSRTEIAHLFKHQAQVHHTVPAQKLQKSD